MHKLIPALIPYNHIKNSIWWHPAIVCLITYNMSGEQQATWLIKLLHDWLQCTTYITNHIQVVLLTYVCITINIYCISIWCTLFRIVLYLGGSLHKSHIIFIGVCRLTNYTDKLGTTYISYSQYTHSKLYDSHKYHLPSLYYY